MAKWHKNNPTFTCGKSYKKDEILLFLMILCTSNRFVNFVYSNILRPIMIQKEAQKSAKMKFLNPL